MWEGSTLYNTGDQETMLFTPYILKSNESKCFLAISKVLIPTKPNQNNSNNNKMEFENIPHCKDDFQSTPPKYLIFTSILDAC